MRKEIINYCNRRRKAVNDQFVEMEIENIDKKNDHEVHNLGWNRDEGEYYSRDYYAGDWWPEEEISYFGGKGGGGKSYGGKGGGFGKGYGKGFQFDPKGKGKTGKSDEKGGYGGGGYKGGKGFGKDGKGGKGFGKGGFQGDCFWCGKFGHSQRNCADKDSYYNYIREGKAKEASTCEETGSFERLEASRKVFQLSSLVSVNPWECLYSETVDIPESPMKTHPPGLTPSESFMKTSVKKTKMPQVRNWKPKQRKCDRYPMVVQDSSKPCCPPLVGRGRPVTVVGLHADVFKASGMCDKEDGDGTDQDLELFCIEEVLDLYNIESEGWIEGIAGVDFVEFTVDSGAADTVGNAEMAQYPVVPSEGSRKGVKYVAASGAVVANEGEMNMSLESAEGHDCGIKVQMAQIRKALLSVSKICASGHEVQFNRSGGTITHAGTGQVIKFRRSEGVYRLRLKIKKDDKSGFTRPGK